MKVKKIHKRSELHPSTAWGDRNGKLYYGYAGEGFTPSPAPVYALFNYMRGQYIRLTNNVPECDEGVSFRSTQSPATVTAFGVNRGIRNRPFLSKLGVTQGKEFICQNGALVSTDHTFLMRQGPGTTATERTRHYETYSEVLFETTTHFFLSNKSALQPHNTYGTARLTCVAKSNNAEIAQVFSGDFDLVYLGKCRTATEGVYRHCIAVFSTRITEASASTSWQYTTSVGITAPTGEYQFSTAGGGAKLHILTVKEDSSASANDFMWLLSGRPLGHGSFGGNYYANRGHKIRVSPDETFVVKDAEGFITRFSYLGHLPELGDETWVTKTVNTNVVAQEQLQQTFGLCHIDFGAPTTFLPVPLITTQHITLPDELMQLRWGFYNSHQTAQQCGAALLAGRTWKVDGKLFGVVTTGNTAYSTYYVERTTPDMPITVLTADMDDQNNLSNISFKFLPVNLGLNSPVEVMLLSSDKKKVWMPNLIHPIRKLGYIDLTDETPVVETHEFADEIIALGTRGDDLLLCLNNTTCTPYLVSAGTIPNISMSLDKSNYVHGETATLTVAADADCTITLKLVQCSHNGYQKINRALTANTPQEFQLKVAGSPSAHLIEVE